MKSLTIPRSTGSMSGDYECPKPGLYTARFVDFSDPAPSQWENDKGERPLRMRLYFQIVGGTYDGAKFNHWVNVSSHTKSKLYQVLVALNGGEEFDTSVDFDLASFEGTECQVMLTQESNDRGTFAKALQFMPAVAEAAPPPPPAPKAPAPKPPVRAAKAPVADDDGWPEE